MKIKAAEPSRHEQGAALPFSLPARQHPLDRGVFTPQLSVLCALALGRDGEQPRVPRHCCE